MQEDRRKGDFLGTGQSGHRVCHKGSNEDNDHRLPKKTGTISSGWGDSSSDIPEW